MSTPKTSPSGSPAHSSMNAKKNSKSEPGGKDAPAAATSASASAAAPPSVSFHIKPTLTKQPSLTKGDKLRKESSSGPAGKSTLSAPQLSAEQIALQHVPRDAAMLELLPRGDVFAAHKLLTCPTAAGQNPDGESVVPMHLRERLALFDQSYSVLRFPHKVYNQVVLDPPRFNETFHTDTIVVPSASGSGAMSSPSGASAPLSPSGALKRTPGGLDIVSSVGDSDGSVSVSTTKLKVATVSDVFDSLGVPDESGRARSANTDLRQAPVPEGYSGKDTPQGPDAEQEDSVSGSPAKKAGPSSDGAEGKGAAAVLPPHSEPGVVLRSYFPHYDWSSGAEVALCERVPLPPPTRASGPGTRFLLHAKSLQLGTAFPPAGREIEPFFCELALYNCGPPEVRGKVSDTFSVQLNPERMVSMLEAGRAAKASKDAKLPASVAAAGVPPAAPSPFVPANYANASSSSPCTRALFHVPPSCSSGGSRSSVALVLLVYKVLQGKLESVLDVYAKGTEVKEKDLKSAESKALQAAQRWGQNRQLLMWSAAPLFNEAGGLVNADFSTLYRPLKTEEAFTLASLTEAASTLLGKKKNPAGFKVVPGQFLCAIQPLPSSRAQAVEFLERVAPVYNENGVPVRMEEVVESTEAICVGQEVLASGGGGGVTSPNSGGAGANGDSLSPPASGSQKSASSASSSATRAEQGEEDKTILPLSSESKPNAPAAGEVVATVAAEEWVEVSTSGSLVRKSTSAGDAPQPSLGLSVSVTAAENAPLPSATPLSPTSRALIQLEHGRQRSYVPPPSSAAMSVSGYIQEIESVEELGLAAASAPGAAQGASSSSASAAAAGAASLAAAAAGSLLDEQSSPFHMHYTNHLYVYPQQITFSDARNVAIGIQIKDTHESGFEPGLELIYPRADEMLAGKGGKGGKTLGSFVSQTFTSTTYHCYNAAFLDEIKIELPLVLKPSHHLLFSFYNISCKDSVVVSKDGSGDDRTLLGYSMLPLYLDNRIVDEGYTLPVCAKLRPHYLLQKDEWDNRRNATFTVRLRVNSSMYTNDPYLNRFFLKCALPFLKPSAASSSDELVKKPKLSAKEAREAGDNELMSLMLKKVLRSGQLKKKGGLKWTERWWHLSETGLHVYKTHKESKVWHHTSISSRTTTVRAPAGGRDQDLLYSWTIRMDGTGLPETAAEQQAALQSPLPGLPEDGSPMVEIMSSSPPGVASPTLAKTASSPPPSTGRASIAERPANFVSPLAGAGADARAAMDAESFESEMSLSADTEDEMFSWLKAIAHAKMSKYTSLESVRSVREAQGELLVRHLPMILRQLVSVICTPDSVVDHAALASEATTVERLKGTCFETLLEVAFLVEAGTPSSGPEKQRNAHLDAWCTYIFDDNSSALPLAPGVVPVEAGSTQNPSSSSASTAASEKHGRSGSVSVSISPALLAASASASAAAATATQASIAEDKPAVAAGDKADDKTVAAAAAATDKPASTDDKPAGDKPAAEVAAEVAAAEKKAESESKAEAKADDKPSSEAKSDSSAVPAPAAESDKDKPAAAAVAPAAAEEKSAAEDKPAAPTSVPASVDSTSAPAAAAPSPTLPKAPAGPKVQRIRSYEALATFWLALLRSGGQGGAGSGTAGASPLSPSASSAASATGLNAPSASASAASSSAGGPTVRSLPPLREYSARFSWLLLDMISKSLLLSTAGARERRVSMAFGGGSPLGGGSLAPGIASAFGPISPRPPQAAGGFFKPSTLKLLSELVSALTHEVFSLSSLSLSLSKTLNKNLALFVRDAFYVLPRQQVHDWVASYLSISYRLESGRVGVSTGTVLGAASGGSSSRFKFTFLQILCDHEHFVAYSLRGGAFVGEARKYMSGQEGGEWNMHDYMTQAPGSTPVADPKQRGMSISSTEEMRHKGSRSESAADRDMDQLSPMREAARSHSPSPSLSLSSGSLRGHGSSPSIGGASSLNGSSSSSGASAPALPMRSPPSGPFLPFVLLKQVWLAFRTQASASPGVQGGIAQEQALAQAAYTLRSVLVKHELDARYQGAKKRSLVASMYVRLLPVLWNNLDKLREKTKPAPSAASSPSAAAANPAASGASLAARKDLVACALYVLHNVSSVELLRLLREGDYRIHPQLIQPWFFKFADLMALLLESVEYAGPLMRRLEQLTNAGGSVNQLATTLCSRMMSPAPPAGTEPGISDWGGAEEIGTMRGAAGGLNALENKYSRTRQNTALIGHRKAAVVPQGGTLKRRDVQQSSNLQAGERARSRLMNRTLNSKSVKTHMDGGDGQFLAITGVDPSLQKWERLYSHEAASIVLHILTTVVLPLSQENLVATPDMQDRLLWFLHGFLKLNQSDQMLQQWFALLAQLLQQHAALLWPLNLKKLDNPRCNRWWFELLRHLSFHNADTRASAQSFIYDLFLSVADATGSTSRLGQPLLRSFARVMDSLRFRKSEDGSSSVKDAAWTVLQADAKTVAPTNDMIFIGVLSALQKSAAALTARAESDPKRDQLATAACIQDISSTFSLLQRIIETSALIHSIKANSIDPDMLIEHCQSMVALYRGAPRVRLLYLKSMYDLHVTQGNTAEAGAVQLRMFRLIHRQSVRISQSGRESNCKLWNSQHAVSCLRKASELFEASELYEQALHAESLAIAHYVARKDPSRVVPHSKRLVTLWEKLATLATLGDTRSFGTFYRVGFYGQPFVALGMHGSEKIYREPNFTKLPEITSRLVALYTGILGREVTVFKDSGAIDRSVISEGAKLQVTAVLPFSVEADAPPALNIDFPLADPPTLLAVPATEASAREDAYEKNTSLRTFYYDTPYTQTQGRSHGTVETQFKKRSLVSLDQYSSFPAHLRRLPVASRVEIDMSPLQCVLEDMHKRIHKLRIEAKPLLGNPDLKTLTQVLSGSVNVQVNGGTAEVCQVFLSADNRDKWNPKELDELRQALGAFVKASGDALKVAVQLANETSENRAFIEILEQGYAALITSVKLAVPDLVL